MEQRDVVLFFKMSDEEKIQKFCEIDFKMIELVQRVLGII